MDLPTNCAMDANEGEENKEASDAVKANKDFDELEKDLNPSPKRKRTSDAIEVNEDVTQRKRNKTDAVLRDFREVSLSNVVKKVECGHCNENIVIKPSGDSTQFQKHLAKFKSFLSTNMKERVLSYKAYRIDLDCEDIIKSYKYDQEKVRESAAEMIAVNNCNVKMLKHEFFNLLVQNMSPWYEKITLMDAQSDCLNLYENEKTKLKEMLNNVNAVSLTVNLWQLCKKAVYVCLTGHFVDDEWNIQKRILNLCCVLPPHTGVAVSDAIFQCLLDWGIANKVSAIVVDSSTAYDVVLKCVKDRIEANGKIYLGGKFFHQHCCAHVIDLMAQDGLCKIQNIIDDIREGVGYLCLSKERLLKFSNIVKQLPLPSRKLFLDVSHHGHWSTTYSMLTSALEFKEVFPRYQDGDQNYCWLPTSEDWERVEDVCKILKALHDVMIKFSGLKHPTANTFLTKIVGILDFLNKKSMDNNPFVQAIAVKMKEKIDKYWGDCHLLMVVAAVLDPRHRIDVLEFYFPGAYPESEVSSHITSARDVLHELFGFYVDSKDSKDRDNNAQRGGLVFPDDYDLEYEHYLQELYKTRPRRSELDDYLEEPRLRSNRLCCNFDAVKWWKDSSCYRYDILPKMACDVLSIPLINRASDSASSAGRKIIDKFHGSLSREMLQALVCSADWLHCLGKIEESSDFEEECGKAISLP